MDDEREGKETQVGSSVQSPREMVVVASSIFTELEISAEKLASENPQAARDLESFSNTFRSEVRKGLSDNGGSFDAVQIAVPAEIQTTVTQLVFDSNRPKTLTLLGEIFQETRIDGLYFKSQRGDLPNQRDYYIVGANHLPKTPA